MKRWRVWWRDERNFLVWTYVKPNLVLSQIPFTGGMVVGLNGLKHVLILEYLRSDEIFKISCVSKQASIHTYRHHSDQISRSPRWAGPTNKKEIITHFKQNKCTFWPPKCHYFLFYRSRRVRNLHPVIMSDLIDSLTSYYRDQTFLINEPKW